MPTAPTTRRVVQRHEAYAELGRAHHDMKDPLMVKVYEGGLLIGQTSAHTFREALLRDLSLIELWTDVGLTPMFIGDYTHIELEGTP